MNDYPAATALFEDYVTNPDDYWDVERGSGQHRQARKLLANLRAKASALGVERAEMVSQIITIGQQRAEKRPPPMYVMGLGGSGSHWLSSMISELVPALRVGEVYFPRRLLNRMEPLSPEEQGFFSDCLHLLHVHGSSPTGDSAALLRARMINAAAGVIHPRLKEWDPRCFVIYLLRDPRDRVMSIVFRKGAYRQAEFPDFTDEQYLIKAARTTADNFQAWRRSEIPADFTCRYEELRSSTLAVLDAIAGNLGEPVSNTRLAHIAREHDESLVRRGIVSRRSNLSATKPSGWRHEASERQRALLHSFLAEVITAAEYPPDDCLGRPVAMGPRGERRLRFPTEHAVGSLFTRGADEPQDAWVGLREARGEVTVPGGHAVKLRVGESTSTEILASLTALPADGLDSLCLAGNRHVDDEFLGTLLSGLGGLQELDISHTAVTGPAPPPIDGLAGLQGVSALGLDGALGGSVSRRTGS